MNREASVQLIYQLAMLIHNFLKFPAIELVYWNEKPGVPTFKWCGSLILQCISALLSAYSTVSLPVQATQMKSLKLHGVYCSIWKNLCILSKRMLQLISHICMTYITIFLLMKSERFDYLRTFISQRLGEDNSESYISFIYGTIIFCVFPFLVILQNIFALTFLVAGRSWKEIQKQFSRFGKKVRIRVENIFCSSEVLAHTDLFLQSTDKSSGELQ